MEFEHNPVMLEKVIQHLNIQPNGIYVDGTLGGAGHASRVVKQLTNGMLIGIDRDREAIEAARERLHVFKNNFIALRGNFNAMPDLLAEQNIFMVDGVLLDLGVSSYQLDTAERGFSYRLDARLDMRMDDRETLTAYEVVNRYPEKQLTEIFYAYGEERFAKKIARMIITKRPIETTLQLAELVEEAVPFIPRTGHPAKRVFQAIRIEVNGELNSLGETINKITDLLKPGSRFCIITFHSLEDRIVKQTFKKLADPCDCPRTLPYCVCEKKPALKVITRKPILPSENEIVKNRRAHSAKLRVAEKI